MKAHENKRQQDPEDFTGSQPNDRTVTFADTISTDVTSAESSRSIHDDLSGSHTSRSLNSCGSESAATSHSADSIVDRKGNKMATESNTVVRTKGNSGSVRSGHSSSSSSGKKSGSSKDREARAAQKERIATTKRFMKDKYSTTSTIYATQSIECPDFPRAMFCIACIMQSVMFDYFTARAAARPPQQSHNYDSSSGCDQSTCSGLSGGGSSWKDSDEDDFHNRIMKHKELRIFPQLPYHLGGVQDPATISSEILEKETMNDPELREAVLNGDVPTIDTILRFITWLHQSAAYSAECNIIAFIYIKRIIGEIVLQMDNWRGVWTGAVILAQKVWDDRPLRTSSFTKVLPGVERTQLRDLEMKFFNLLNFSTNVRPSVYARYYFELREIFKCLVGPEASMNARKKPLSILNAKLMEKRTSAMQDSNAVRAKARATTAAAVAARDEQQQQLAYISSKQRKDAHGSDTSDAGEVASEGNALTESSNMRSASDISTSHCQHKDLLERTPYSQHQSTPAIRERISLISQSSINSTGSTGSDSVGEGSSVGGKGPVGATVKAGFQGRVAASAGNSPAVNASKLRKSGTRRTKTTDDLDDRPMKPSFYVLS